MPNPLKIGFLMFLLILVILFSILRGMDNADRNAEQIADEATYLFNNTVRSKGYVDVRDLDILQKTVDRSGVVFKIDLEYQKKTTQPVYTDPNNPATFQNTFNVNFEGYYTQSIVKVLYPGNALPVDDPSRRFNMHEGDLFLVSLESKGMTLSSQLRRFMFNQRSIPIIVRHGGMVRSEAP